MSTIRRWSVLALLVFAPIWPRALAAQQEAAPRDTQTIRQQLDSLDQRVQILGRQLGRDSTAGGAARPQPRVTAGPGFVILSTDSSFQFRPQAVVQTDGRFYGGGAQALGNSTFLLRRLRPIVEVTAWRYFTARLEPDYGQGTTVLYDAYTELRLWPAFGLRAGKAKTPVGLEQLQSDRDLPFVERGLPTNLVPVRDVGLQALGAIEQGILSYAVGVFNGVPDRTNADGDATNNKDVGARLFARPFARTSGPLRNFGFGIAGSNGIDHGTLAAPALPSYVTPGQQTLFKYDSATAQGTRSRVNAQAYWYVGPVGVLSEYVVSSQRVARGAAAANIQNSAWQVEGSVYLTGEYAAFGTVTPRHPFDPAKHQWGALELSVRYSELTIDPDAFPTFALATQSVKEANAWGVDLTWRFAPAILLAVTYEVTQFTGGATVGNRPDEHFLVTRVQEAL
jgi:phosphate-selective porin OprO and OprP